MGAEHPAFAIPKSLAGEIVWMHPRFLTSNFHSMEPHVFAWIGKYVRAGSVALDIGANFGMMSLYMGRITGPTGRVFAFEPSPANGTIRGLTFNLLTSQSQTRTTVLFHFS
jgi:hypothetical protein